MQHLHLAAALFGLGVAPVFYLFSWIYRARFADATLQWRKPQYAFFTIAAFTSGLGLFALGAFLLAAHVGRVHLPWPRVAQDELRLLGVDALLGFGGVLLAYFGVQNYLVQYVTPEGVVLGTGGLLRSRRRARIMRWTDVADYYMVSEYTITWFNFLVRDGKGGFERVTVKTPFYTLTRFEATVEKQLKRALMQRPSPRRNVSPNVSSE